MRTIAVAMVNVELIDRAKEEKRIAFLRFVRDCDNFDALPLPAFAVLCSKVVGVTSLSCSSPIGFDRNRRALRVLVLLF